VWPAPPQSRDEYLNNRRGPDSGLRPHYWAFGEAVVSGWLAEVRSSSEFTLGPEASGVADAYAGPPALSYRLRLHGLAEDRAIVTYTSLRRVFGLSCPAGISVPMMIAR
jgi:hypothetical protein